MPMLDAFKTDAFSTVSLTTAINKLPYVPGYLGKQGIFASKPIATTTAVVEERHGKLSLIPTAARGTMPTVYSGNPRYARSFLVPHYPLNDSVQADDVQNIRAFGSETAVETLSSLINDKMGTLKQNHEINFEFQRIGAIKGLVIDSDGATLFDWFSSFGITPSADVDFDLGNATPVNIKQLAMGVERTIRTALGATPVGKIYAACGDEFWDKLINHSSVVTAWERYQDGQFLRDSQVEFVHAGISWYNYIGGVDSVGDGSGTYANFIPTADVRFYPMGVPELFQHIKAPANFAETVNTMGQDVYAKQERMEWDMGVKLHTQSNSIMMCTRPAVLVRGYTSS